MRAPQKSYLKNQSVTIQTETLKIKAGFPKKKLGKVEIITRVPAKLRPRDFSLRFLTYKTYILAEF